MTVSIRQNKLLLFSSSTPQNLWKKTVSTNLCFDRYTSQIVMVLKFLYFDSSDGAVPTFMGLALLAIGHCNIISIPGMPLFIGWSVFHQLPKDQFIKSCFLKFFKKGSLKRERFLAQIFFLFGHMLMQQYGHNAGPSNKRNVNKLSAISLNLKVDIFLKIWRLTNKRKLNGAASVGKMC